MDGLRFDAWTRRRLGLAAGSSFAALFGLAAIDEVAARPNKKKKRKKRCRRLRQLCRPGNQDKRCCAKQDLVCGAVLDLGGRRCCRPFRGLCITANECCGALGCDKIEGLGTETRCCSGGDGFCTADEDCCEGFDCNTADRQCVPG